MATASLGTATLSPETLSSVRHWQELQRGDSLGRYLVLEAVGRGSMGQVYSAYDPKLDRKVALKVLAASRGRREALRSRLIREARALARLNHPNVVSIFDAETVDDRVFIATEFVVGQTLSEWLQHAPRSQAEILRTLFQAGEGLAAAHEADLVHRDFKGSNVIVADSGRVVVLDFGLARQLDEGPAPTELPGWHEIEHKLDIEQVKTRTGAVLGTPAFMAPEQRKGAVVGPAADQFSFCTVAFRALTGVLPAQDLDGTAAASLSPGLRGLLRQGLMESPEKRHASMSVLLGKLRHEAGRVRRRWLWAAVIVAIFAISSGWWQAHSRQQARCGVGADLFSKVWNPERQAGLRERLLEAAEQSQLGNAGWLSITTGLDDYGGAWAEMYRDACEATHRLGRQSQELLDLRMDCLDQRLREVDAALKTLADGGPGRLDVAPRLISNLPLLTTCRDTRALRSPSPPPEDPAQRRELDELRHDLAGVKALWLVGDYGSGREAAETLSRGAQDLGYWPLTAEVLIEKARFLESQGDSEAADQALVETLLAAQAGGHARVAAEALVRRVRVQGYLLRQFDEAERAAAQAKSVLERLSEPAPLSAELDEVRGLIAMQQGRFDQAKQLFESALELKRNLHGVTHLSLAPTFSRLGELALEQGRLDEAQLLLEQALAINRRHLGGEHANVAGALAQLGALALDKGAFGQALEYHSEALGIRRQAFQEQPVRVAMSLTDIANALNGLGRFQEAVASFEQANQIFERELGPDHLFLAIGQSNLAAAYIRQSLPKQALPLYRKAFDIQSRNHGAEHPRTLQASFNLAEALRRSGQVDLAIDRLQRVIDQLSSQVEAPSFLLTDARACLGEAHLDVGRAERALPLLMESLAARPEAGRRPDLWAKNAFALARALQVLDQEPERAIELARAALDRYPNEQISYRAEIEMIEQWLKLHGP